MKHFLEAMEDYLHAVGQQAEDRDKLVIRDVDSYLEARRKDSAVLACFMPGELHLSIPDEAFYHPVVKELQYASTVMVVLDNVRDMVSSSVAMVYSPFGCRTSHLTTESRPQASEIGTSSRS